MRMTRGVFTFLGFGAAGVFAAAGAAQAQLTSADVGVNPTFEQTGPSTVTSTGGFFSGRAFFTSTTDFSAGTLTYGGMGSPATLVAGSPPPSLTLGVGDTSFSDLQTLFPAGGYTFDLTGGTMGPIEFAINYAGNAYSNTPELTAASYNALQGMNAVDPLTVDFNAMDVSPNATPGANNIYFSIVNSSNTTVFSDALPTTATSLTIPSGTLVAGQTYSFDLLFDDRIVTTDDEEGVSLTQFYDTHTDGSFTTAAGSVPEPATWAMMMLGFVGLGYARYRRSRNEAASGIAA
jgi:PEP-CTERM motif